MPTYRPNYRDSIARTMVRMQEPPPLLARPNVLAPAGPEGGTPAEVYNAWRHEGLSPEEAYGMTEQQMLANPDPVDLNWGFDDAFKNVPMS